MKCGKSEIRNTVYFRRFSKTKYFNRLLKTKTPIILDIGAHKGESLVFFKKLFKKALLYSFEPNPDTFKILNKSAKKYKAKAFNIAISDKNKNVLYYKQQLSHLGGLHPINRNSSDSIKFAKKAQNLKLKVKSFTLDKFIKLHKIKRIDLCKIDVQGSETQVLKGGESSLKKINALIIELNLFDFYGAHNNLYSIEKIMNKYNLKLWDILKISKNPVNFRTDWVELVYKKEA